MPIRFRPRFSLLTLLLTSLLCGSGALLWVHREPWQVRMTIREKDVLEYAAYADGDATIYTVCQALGNRLNEPLQPVIHVYAPDTGRLLVTIKGRAGDSFSPSFAGKDYIVTESRVRPIRGLDPFDKTHRYQFWRTDTGDEIQIPELNSSDFSIDFISPQGTSALISHARKRWIVSLPFLEHVRELADIGSPEFQPFSPDDKWLGLFHVTHGELSIHLYPTAAKGDIKVIHSIASGRGNERLPRLHCMSYSPNGRWGVYNSFSKQRLWLVDIEAGICVQPFEDYFSAFSDDSQFIATILEQGGAINTHPKTFRVWKIGDTSPPRTFVERSDADGRLTIANGRVMCRFPFHIWDLESGATILADSNANATFSNDGKFAYVWSRGKHYVCATNGTTLHTFEAPKDGEQFGLDFAKIHPECVTYYAPTDDSAPSEHTNEVHVWSRRRPEFWYGYAWLWEFWLFVVIAGAWVWSVVQPVGLKRNGEKK